MMAAEPALLAIANIFTGGGGCRVVATGNSNLIKLNFWQVSDVEWQKGQKNFVKTFFFSGDEILYTSSPTLRSQPV
jgi:hypothetical protein